MTQKLITLIVAMSAAAFMPAAMACDGACGGGNNTNTWNGRHHITTTNQGQQPGTGEGLNNGVNLSLDRPQQTQTKNHKNWTTNQKWHKGQTQTNS
jgi:hypothetical protein